MVANGSARPTGGLIYGLVDPRDGGLRYVGQTIRTIDERLDGHLYDKSSTPKCRWIAELRELGLQPSIVALLECSADNLNLEEVGMIAAVRSVGARLLNVLHGNCLPTASGNSDSDYVPAWGDGHWPRHHWEDKPETPDREYSLNRMRAMGAIGLRKVDRFIRYKEATKMFRSRRRQLRDLRRHKYAMREEE